MLPPADATKASWRRWARATRAAVSNPESSAAVSAGLRRWPSYQNAGRVLLYLAFGGEVDLAALTDDDKTFFVTRTWPQRPDLSVHRLDPQVLETHPFGYRQPRAEAAAVDPASLDVALVPGLAFDRAGRRLGYGAGYFDRLLPTLRPGVPRVGVTFEALLVAALPAADHDVPMTHLATELGVHQVTA